MVRSAHCDQQLCLVNNEPFSQGCVSACAGLPKTRSGKIMRRILRKIAVKKDDELGDTSTLADPGIVQGIIELRGK